MTYVDRYLKLIAETSAALQGGTGEDVPPTKDWQRLRFLLSTRYDAADFGVSVLDIAETDPGRYYKYINPTIAAFSNMDVELIMAMGYRIVDELWLEHETPMLMAAHERFFGQLGTVPPEERTKHSFVACNSIRRPDGSTFKMISFARQLDASMIEGGTTFIVYHYPTADQMPVFVVTSFDTQADVAAMAPYFSDTSTEVQSLGQTSADRSAVSMFERYRVFLGHLSQISSALTPAEERICIHMVEGLSTKEISAALSLSQRTIENQRMSIRRKLGLREKENLTTVLRGIHAFGSPHE